MNGCSDSPSLMSRLLVTFGAAAAVAVSGVTFVSPALAQSFPLDDTPVPPPPPPPFIPVPIVPTSVPTPTHLLTLDGTNYNVRVETGLFSGQLATDVESSPWWNSSSTAQSVADLVGLDGNGVSPLVAYSQEEIDIPCVGGPGTCNAPPPFAGVLFWRSQFSCFLFSCGIGENQGFADVASENNYLVASPSAAVPEPSEILGLGVAAGWLGTVALKHKRKRDRRSCDVR